MMDGRGPLEMEIDPILAQKRTSAHALLDAASPLALAYDGRDAAADRFVELGAPHKRDEYWRFTGAKRLDAPARAQSDSTAAPPLLASAEAATILYVNGVLDRASLDALDDPAVTVSALGDPAYGSVDAPLEIDAHRRAPRPLAALNAARATGGLRIHVSAAARRPIRILAQGGGVLRHTVTVDPGASATIIEDRDGAGRLSAVIEATLADGARLDHLRMQPDASGAEDVAFLFASLGASSALKSFTLTAGAGAGRHARNETVLSLTGAEGSAHVAGATIGGGDATLDQTVFLTHAAEGCESRQVFKNVLGASSTGVFQGKILVEQPAQKTDGYQISQSILLDDRAAFQAKPELEIYADDVKCSHGSTTGAIDAAALFYLTSRGVPKSVATRLLIEAFLEDAIAEIGSEDLQDAVRAAAATMIGLAAP